MSNEIKINKNNKSITFINNGTAFSQFGVADEILDLISNLQNKLQQKENIIKEVREYIIEYFRADIDCPNYMKIYINDYYKLLEILDKENEDIEFDMLKALNTDLDDDVEMG